MEARKSFVAFLKALLGKDLIQFGKTLLQYCYNILTVTKYVGVTDRRERIAELLTTSFKYLALNIKN